MASKEADFPNFAKVLKTDLTNLYWPSMPQKDPIVVAPPEPEDDT